MVLESRTNQIERDLEEHFELDYLLMDYLFGVREEKNVV